MTNKILILLLLLMGNKVFSQKSVAITIDDVPNCRKFEDRNFKTDFLDHLDRLQIPVAIFINEGQIYKTQSVSKNFDLLNEWIKRKQVTVGNHTFAHSRYSTGSYEKFIADIEKGEAISSELAKVYHKQYKYFRFPYNDLGNDSVQQNRIELFLNEKKCTIAPFTIESSDWIFNYLYEHYLKCNKKKEAQRIANAYLETTMAYFHYFDSLSVQHYGRSIKQIYLCHDNAINADYINVLVKRLKEKSYTFCTLDEAMQDEVYTQKSNYRKKWGISWFYRWMKDPAEIKKVMRSEPDMMDIYKEYQDVLKKEK